MSCLVCVVDWMAGGSVLDVIVGRLNGNNNNNKKDRMIMIIIIITMITVI